MKQLAVEPFLGPFLHPFYRQQFNLKTPASFRYVLQDPRLHEKGMWGEIANGTSKAGPRQLPRRVAVSLIDKGYWGTAKFARSSPSDHRDLVHSCQYLLRDSGLWVVDLEDVTCFTWYSRNLLQRPRVRDQVRRSLHASDCRRLLPWTSAARKSLLAALGEDLAEKTTVVYPFANPNVSQPVLPARPSVLFVGGAWFPKGGYESLLAFERIRSEFPDCVLRIVSFVPERIRRKFERVEQIEFHERVPNEVLARFYREATVLCFPTHMDTLGLVVLEAYSWGVPVIGTRHYALPELVLDGKSGILVDTETSYFDDDCLPRYPPVRGWGEHTYDHPLVRQLMQPSDAYVDELADAMRKVLGDDALRSQLAAGALELVTSGRFCAGRRASELQQIYLAASPATA